MVSDLITFADKGCKIAVQFFSPSFFLANFALLAGFFVIGATIRIGREILCLPYAGFCLMVQFHPEGSGHTRLPCYLGKPSLSFSTKV